MGYMAVLVNCALIGLSGQVHRMFPDMTATQTILLIVALEVIRFKQNYSVHIINDICICNVTAYNVVHSFLDHMYHT